MDSLMLIQKIKVKYGLIIKINSSLCYLNPAWKKNCGTGLVPAKSTGTGPEPVPAHIPPDFRSGPNITKIYL